MVQRGYQPIDHRRIILNTYIDHKLETRLSHDEPLGTRWPIMGAQGCIARLAQYFRRNKRENKTIKPELMTPTDPIVDKDGWLLIDLLEYHGGQAAQAREHEHFRRRKGYTNNLADQKQTWHPASDNNPNRPPY